MEELAAAVGLSTEALRKRIMFWVNQVGGLCQNACFLVRVGSLSA